MGIIAIIPARGGSKGLTKKNIKSLNGKPLIFYTIEEAKKSVYIDKVVVSTDDEEIADIAKQIGAEVPFLRPKELAKDDTPGIYPIVHAVKWIIKEKNYIPEYVVNLQPTSPLRTADDIDKAIEKIMNSNFNYLVSVCEAQHHPYWMKTIEQDMLKDFVEQGSDKALRRQDLPQVYSLNGAVYVYKTETLLMNPFMTDEKVLPYIMPKERSVDIDDFYDFKFAELLIKERESYD